MLEVKFRPGEKEIWLNREKKPKYQYPKKKKKVRRKRKSKPVTYIKPVTFTETAVGHYIYVYAPIEFYMLIEFVRIMEQKGRYFHNSIHPHDIEQIAIRSGNPVFQTVTFRRALIDYKRYGVRPRKKVEWTSREAVHYAKYSGPVHKLMKMINECAGQ